MTPLQRYLVDLERPGFKEDTAQYQVMEVLDGLHQRLIAPEPRRSGLLGRFLSRGQRVRPPHSQGLYLWGGVGRGKTYLVDTFYACLPFHAKRRLHFHRFMRYVHRQLRDLPDHRDPLAEVAEAFVCDTRVLCLDEFYVSDITDAMLLAGLLEALFDRGLTLVVTSNLHPQNLYRDGLQRERFLPAIAMLEERLEVMELASGEDYRLRILESTEAYRVPSGPAADARLMNEFRELTGRRHDGAGRISIEDRDIPVRAIAEGVAWFDFSAICDGPRNQIDYIEIARLFHTVLVSDIPAFDAVRDDQARRFISMVDEFYDRSVKLVVSAAVEPEQLYQGVRLGFAFERTVSRLKEMQTRSYLQRPHRP